MRPEDVPSGTALRDTLHSKIKDSPALKIELLVPYVMLNYDDPKRSYRTLLHLIDRGYGFRSSFHASMRPGGVTCLHAVPQATRPHHASAMTTTVPKSAYVCSFGRPNGRCNFVSSRGFPLWDCHSHDIYLHLCFLESGSRQPCELIVERLGVQEKDLGFQDGRGVCSEVGGASNIRGRQVAVLGIKSSRSPA